VQKTCNISETVQDKTKYHHLMPSKFKRHVEAY